MTAFVGRTDWGPVNTPTQVGSFADFGRMFGGLSASSPVSYAVRDFFQNGGARAVIVRLYSGDVTSGTATVTLPTAGSPPGQLVLSAASPGAWAAGALTVSVDLPSGITLALATEPGVTHASMFNLTVTFTRSNGAVLTERFMNVSVDAGAGAQRLDRVVNNQSNFIRYSYPTAIGSPPSSAVSPPEPTPAQQPVKAVGGEASRLLALADYVPSNPAGKTGIYALDTFRLFNILCIPPDNPPDDHFNGVWSAAATYCHSRRAFLLIDPPAQWTNDWLQGQTSRIGMADIGTALGDDGEYAAVYFPNIIEPDPLLNGQPGIFPPCGAVAGIMARTDASRGVWKAPAGVNDGTIIGSTALSAQLTDTDSGMLNPLGINCLRTFRVYGNVVWGSRTVSGADQQANDYKYIPIRRLALFIEESLYRGTKWAVFEPNDEPLWSQLRLSIGSFMNDLYRKGAFQGSSAKDAYFVICDGTTTTPNDIDLGMVNVTVGFAPLKPAEFVVLSIQQQAGQVRT